MAEEVPQKKDGSGVVKHLQEMPPQQLVGTLEEVARRIKTEPPEAWVDPEDPKI